MHRSSIFALLLFLQLPSPSAAILSKLAAFNEPETEPAATVHFDQLRARDLWNVLVLSGLKEDLLPGGSNADYADSVRIGLLFAHVQQRSKENADKIETVCAANVFRADPEMCKFGKSVAFMQLVGELKVVENGLKVASPDFGGFVETLKEIYGKRAERLCKKSPVWKYDEIKANVLSSLIPFQYRIQLKFAPRQLEDLNREQAQNVVKSSLTQFFANYSSQGGNYGALFEAIGEKARANAATIGQSCDYEGWPEAQIEFCKFVRSVGYIQLLVASLREGGGSPDALLEQIPFTGRSEEAFRAKMGEIYESERAKLGAAWGPDNFRLNVKHLFAAHHSAYPAPPRPQPAQQRQPVSVPLTGTAPGDPQLAPAAELQSGHMHSPTAFEQVPGSGEGDGGSSHGKCAVCLTREDKTALIPCGHVLCDVCTRTILSLEMSKRICPICRRPITDTLRLFHSTRK